MAPITTTGARGRIVKGAFSTNERPLRGKNTTQNLPRQPKKHQKIYTTRENWGFFILWRISFVEKI
tara:strand:+ start:1331 stop:1528 length:198 start_codon:yes stop_codon:yes gene_type:complete